MLVISTVYDYVYLPCILFSIINVCFQSQTITTKQPVTVTSPDLDWCTFTDLRFCPSISALSRQTRTSCYLTSESKMSWHEARQVKYITFPKIFVIHILLNHFSFAETMEDIWPIWVVGKRILVSMIIWIIIYTTGLD